MAARQRLTNIHVHVCVCTSYQHNVTFQSVLQLKCESPDNFNQLVLPAALSLATKTSLLGYMSPLLETTVMVFPPCLVTTETKLTTAGFIEVLDFLTQAGFAVCGLKMVLLSEETGRTLCHCCDSLDTKVCPLGTFLGGLNI